MLGPIGALDKRPVVFVDVLTPMLPDLYRAFDVQFVLTSNVFTGHVREVAASALVQAGLPLAAQHLHVEWLTPWDPDLNCSLDEEVDAWHAAAAGSTPTAFLIVASTERVQALSQTLRSYAIASDDPSSRSMNYIEACRILHSQTTFEPFNPDWY